MTQESTIRFLLRLQGKLLRPDEESGSQSGDSAPIVNYSRPQEHLGYNMSEEVKIFIRDDLIENVVVALAELERTQPPELVRILQDPSTSISQEQTPIRVDSDVRSFRFHTSETVYIYL